MRKQYNLRVSTTKIISMAFHRRDIITTKLIGNHWYLMVINNQFSYLGCDMNDNDINIKFNKYLVACDTLRENL